MEIDRRSTQDRRSYHRPRLKFLLLGGRRKSARRYQDKKTFIYADQYHPWLLVATLLLVVLSISDALLSLSVIEHGAIEKNPIGVNFLNMGVGPFMVAKLLLASSAILIVLVYHKYFFRPLRIYVKVIIPAFATVFVVAWCWHIYLNN
jgi:hypothetical protein